MNAIIERLNIGGASFVEFAAAMLIQSSLLIAAMLVVDLLIRRTKKVRAVVRYWLWMIVLVKLLLPVTLSAPTGIGYWVAGAGGEGLLNPVAEQTATARAGADPIPQRDEPPASERPDAPMLERPATASPGPRHQPSSPAATPPIAQSGDVEPSPQPAPTVAPAPPAAAITWQAVVLLVWAVVVAAMALLLVQRWLFVKSLIAQAESAGEKEGKLVRLLVDCRQRLGIRPGARIGLKLSAAATSPAVCGLIRPVILIPRDMPDKLDARSLQAVLLHELAHVKRRDLPVNFLQAILQIAYFYNPLLWLANAVIRRIREQAVDETVLVAMGNDADAYPDTLVSVARLALARPALSLRLIGVVESKKALTGRIKHILSRPLPKSARLGVAGAICLILAAALLLLHPEVLALSARWHRAQGYRREAARLASLAGGALARRDETPETRVPRRLYLARDLIAGGQIDQARAMLGSLGP